MLHSTRALVFVLATIIAGAAAGCRSSEPITITELSAIADLDKAGKRLMRVEDGLARLDEPATQHPVAVVAVHGLASKGKEWIEPLADLAEDEVELYFFRWNDKRCPDKGAAALAEALRGLTARSSHLERLVIVAHSYGGVITALVSQREALGLPVEVHIIASPLASTGKLDRLCDFEGVPAEAPAESVTWRQWRTVKEQDGVYADMDVDPQLVELPELEVTQLPASEGEVKLGHNRSISWVVDHLPTLTATPPSP